MGFYAFIYKEPLNIYLWCNFTLASNLNIMRVAIISIVSLLTIIGLNVCNEAKVPGYPGRDADMYYYAQDKKVYLRIEKHQFILGIKETHLNDFDPNSLKAFNLQLEHEASLSGDMYYVKTIPGKRIMKHKQLISELREEPYVAFIYPVMRPVNQNTSLLLPTNEVLCAPKSDVTGQEVQEVMSEIATQIEKDDDYGDFVIRIRKDSEQDVIEIANYLYESGAMDYAYPNFIATMK